MEKPKLLLHLGVWGATNNNPRVIKKPPPDNLFFGMVGGGVYNWARDYFRRSGKYSKHSVHVGNADLLSFMFAIPLPGGGGC